MRVRQTFALLVLSTSAAVLSGCFSMQPVHNVTPPSGSVIAIDVNDAGRVALEPSMGREIDQIHGSLIREDSDTYYVAVSSVDFLHGGSQSWTGEVVPIKTAYTSTLYSQVFSARRTAVIGAAAVVAVAVMTQQGLSNGSAPVVQGVTPPPEDAKQRVAAGFKIPVQPAKTLSVIHHLWSALALRF